jgi:hypothetical protein
MTVAKIAKTGLEPEMPDIEVLLDDEGECEHTPEEHQQMKEALKAALSGRMKTIAIPLPVSGSADQIGEMAAAMAMGLLAMEYVATQKWPDFLEWVNVAHPEGGPLSLKDISTVKRLGRTLETARQVMNLKAEEAERDSAG